MGGMTTKPFDELAASIEAERQAWLAVKDHLPGAKGHDPRLWDAWIEAMRRCREARAPQPQPPYPHHADRGGRAGPL